MKVDDQILVSEFLKVLDLVGTFAFAVSGAVSGVKHRIDLFSVLVLSPPQQNLWVDSGSGRRPKL